MLRYFFLFVLVLMGVARPAHSEGVALALLDMAVIMEKAKAAQSIEEQIKTISGTFRNELSQLEQKVRSDEQALYKKRDTFSKEQMEAEKKKLRDNFAEGQKMAQDNRRALQQSMSEANKTFRDALDKAIRDVTTSHKIDLVVTKQAISSGIVWAEPKMDITEDVLVKLNDALPNVKVRVPVTTK